MEIILRKRPRKKEGEENLLTEPSVKIIEHPLPKKMDLHFSSEKDDWETPRDFYSSLNCVFDFKLDPCCYPFSAKCEAFFTKENNGLIQDWSTYPAIFMNPPYGRGIMVWMKKAYHTSLSSSCPVIVCLVPARTASKWCQFTLRFARAITFVKGRLKFGDSSAGAPFPSLVAVFSRRPLKEEQKKLLTSIGKTFFNSSI